MYFIKEFSQIWMHNIQDKVQGSWVFGHSKQRFGPKSSWCFKTIEAFPSKQILIIKPRASPPVLVIYVYIYFSERINIVGSK